MPVRAGGVAQIKTLAAVRGSGVHSNERHVHQFQIASLELERTRRARERQAALVRIQGLEERLAEIDALIRKHQAALGDAAPASPAPCEREAAVTQKRRTLRY